MLILLAAALLWVALTAVILAACRVAARTDELGTAAGVPAGSGTPAPLRAAAAASPRRGVDALAA